MIVVRNQPSSTYRLSLMENGVDFVISGIETFFIKDSPEPPSYKYAILHIFAGVLLLLKERLARVRPSLVFENEAHYGQNNASTTNYRQTIKRLKANGVIINPARLAVLDEIRNLRNAIEHYEVEITLASTREVIGKLIAFIHIFCADELQFYLDAKLPSHLLDRYYELKEIGEHVMAEIEADTIAEYEAEDAYFRAFEKKYRSMPADDLLALFDEIRSLDEQLIECPYCNVVSLALFEVGACTNLSCRATPRLDVCHYCLGSSGIAFDGSYYCNRCEGG